MRKRISRANQEKATVSNATTDASQKSKSPQKKSELNKSWSSTSSASTHSSERQRASEARKKLPKNAELRCATVVRLFCRVMNSPTTKSSMSEHCQKNPAF